jgi:carboxyl-terminal processing protease
MSGNRKFPFIKPNFKKIPQVEEDELVEDDIREIVVEHKSGFNTIEVLIIIIISIAFGVVVGCSVTFFRQEYRGEKVSSSLQELIAIYNNILEDYYKNVDERDLVDAAVEGMLSSLDDPYSTYMDEENAATFNETVDGSYVGIGITIAMNADKKFYVVSVVEDSPAEKANIQVGDYLLKIDDQLLEGLNLSDVTSIIKKDEKTTLELTLERDGKEAVKEVKPATIDFISVTSDVYALNNGNAGYISIDTFAANTFQQFKAELKKLEKKNINSLIIDVRSNPGGHLSQTKNILELFMKKNTILYQVQFKDDINKIKDNTKKSRTYPVVILVNSSSASAAEILAASFRDSYSDATLIGETTYGKGTVQTAYTLSDGTSVKYTTEKWLTPKGKWIDGKGVSPNRVVQLTEEYLTNPIPENDLQLQTALDFLEKERNTSNH